MEKSQRDAIRRTRVRLSHDLVLDDLYNFLEQEGIFTSYALEFIQGEGVRPKQINRLLNDLTKRPPRDFEKFCHCLEETDQKHLADELRQKEQEERAKVAGGGRSSAGAFSILTSTPVTCTQGSGSLRSSHASRGEKSMDVDQPIIAQPESASTASQFQQRIQDQANTFSAQPQVTNPYASQPQVTSPFIAQPEDANAVSSQPQQQSHGDDTDRDDIYPLNTVPKGYAIIINNEIFPNSRYADRLGSHKDAEDVEKLFRYLGYSTDVKFNCKAEEMKVILQSFAQLDVHKDVDSTVVVLSSHGQRGEIVGSDSHAIPLTELFAYFNGQNCRNLRTKPKLFFVQACRGTDEDTGYVVPDADADVPMSATPSGDDFYSSLPRESDFLISYATGPGNVSYRNTQSGSWFLQTICKVFREKAHTHDLLSMLTKVNDRVAQLQTQIGYRKQMPHPYFTLRKKLYFF